MRARMRCWCSGSATSWQRPPPKISSPNCWPSGWARPASSPARTSPSARAAAAMPRCCAIWGPSHGIEAETVAPVLLDGERISSGRVREALKAGDPGAATRLLTRPFAIEGEVIHGDKRGRALGWPTANVELGNYLRPAYGIYAVRRDARRRQRARRRRQPWRPPDLRPAAGVIGSGAVRLRWRPLRPDDRGRTAPLPPPRSEVRQRRGAEKRRWTPMRPRRDCCLHEILAGRRGVASRPGGRARTCRVTFRSSQ